MPNIVDIYTDAVYENLRPLYGNWEPGKPAQLGDYGLMSGRVFITLGNIADLGIQFAVRPDDKTDQKFFVSKSSTDVTFHAQGTVTNGAVNAKASLEVKFSSENAAFFNAAECRYSMVADKVALGRAVKAKYKADEWQKEWAVVTDLVDAGATTIVVSGAASSAITFEAKTDVPQINLGDASLGLAVKSASNVGYQVVAEKGLSPLLGLCKIQPRFLWWFNEFKPLSQSLLGNPRLLSVTADAKGAGDDEEGLVFGQMW